MGRLHQIEDRMDNLIKGLAEKFKAEYGSTICNDIETKLSEDPSTSGDPAGKRGKRQAWCIKEKCPGVVGNASRWIAEFILEERSKEISDNWI